MREDECYNCAHLKEEHLYGLDSAGGEECEVDYCTCLEWEPFPDDE